jgi:hypothetical protein
LIELILETAKTSIRSFEEHDGDLCDSRIIQDPDERVAHNAYARDNFVE